MRELPTKKGWVVMTGITRTLPLLLPLIFSISVLAAHAPSPRHVRPLPLASLCDTTPNATLCLATLSAYPSSHPSALLPDLTAFLLSQALATLNRTSSLAQQFAAHQEAAAGKFTLQDCLELLDDASDSLTRSVDRLSHLDSHAPPASLRSQIMDVRVWLSSSLTYLDTCWDELDDPTAAPLKARFSTINLDIEPLLAIALSMAQTLQQDGGASTSYALPRHHLSSPSHP